MKQLYANNAKTTLATSITPTSTSLVVLDGSMFPSPGAYEYFLCTIELSSSIEVVMITNRTGNTLTIGGLIDVGQTVAGRGQEGTSALAFSVGARVECRVTKGTLSRNSTGLAPLASVDYLVAPKDAYNAGFITGTVDTSGNPITTFARDNYTWRFLTHTSQTSGTVSSTSTTTSFTATAAPSVSGVAANVYIIQFTSGLLSGMVRQVTSVSGNIVTWATATPSAPANGDTFELLKSNASILAGVLTVGDDAVIMPLLLGGE